jgi:pimeloyl-ACP methyl ester carboxylesterase
MSTVSAPEVSYSDGFYTSNDGLALYYRLCSPPLPDIKSSASVSSRLKSDDFRSRKTILCLPGVSRNHRDFMPLVGKLPAHVNWLLVDLRGRGYSTHDPNPANYNPLTYVSDICRLLDHLELNTVDIVGTSLGGILTMMLNAQHPQRVGRVVLNDIGAIVEREAVANIGSYLRQAHQHTNWDSVVTAIKPVYSDFFTDLTEEDWYALARRLYRQQPDASLKPDYDPALFSNSEAAELNLWPFFDTLRDKPTLIIRGANSGLLTPAILAQMTASRSDLNIATVPNRGHAPFLNEPIAVAAIKDFLAIA